MHEENGNEEEEEDEGQLAQPGATSQPIPNPSAANTPAWIRYTHSHRIRRSRFR